MVTAPVLAMLNFTKPFVLEMDASRSGIRAILSQEGKPIAYLSKAIKGKTLGLSTYEKEFLAILMATQKWRHYLLPKRFVIKTDHESLKHLLEQKVVTPMQQKRMWKLMWFKYTITYRKGKKNIAADALSRREVESGASLAITVIVLAWISELEGSYKGDVSCEQLIRKVTLHPESLNGYSYGLGVLRYKGEFL